MKKLTAILLSIMAARAHRSPLPGGLLPGGDRPGAAPDTLHGQVPDAPGAKNTAPGNEANMGSGAADRAYWEKNGWLGKDRPWR